MTKWASGSRARVAFVSQGGVGYGFEVAISEAAAWLPTEQKPIKIRASNRVQRTPLADDGVDLVNAYLTLHQRSGEHEKVVLEMSFCLGLESLGGKAAAQKVGNVFDSHSTAYILEVHGGDGAGTRREAEVLKLRVAVDQSFKARAVQAFVESCCRSLQLTMLERVKFIGAGCQVPVAADLPQAFGNRVQERCVKRSQPAQAGAELRIRDAVSTQIEAGRVEILEDEQDAALLAAEVNRRRDSACRVTASREGSIERLLDLVGT
jgi:hypothetical protein